jgi:lipopolysaccharide transport system permease protein
MRAAAVVITPRRGILDLDLEALWRHRELLYFLVWRDMKVRYKQTMIGAGWVVLQPLLTVLIYTVIFSHFARMPSDGLPYPLFAFAAIVPWSYCSQAVVRGTSSLVFASSLVSKVYFPRLIIPMAAVTAPLVELALSFVAMLGLMLWYGVVPSARLVMLPLFLLVGVGAALAAGVLLSAVNVRYRDVENIIPFLIQVWMFASPVVYPVSIVPPSWRAFYWLNPMAGVIESFRWALLGTDPFPLAALATATVVVTLMLGVAVCYFRAVERTMADVI